MTDESKGSVHGHTMSGSDLFNRVVTTIQETNLKIGDSFGSISLYYPFDGDYGELVRGFRESSEDYPDIIVEKLPQRVRIIVPEKDSKRMSNLPPRETMKDVVNLTREHASINSFRSVIQTKYPGSRIYESPYMEFNWMLVFPEELDDDIYCLTEEMGQITYHRYSRDEFLAFGFEIPED